MRHMMGAVPIGRAQEDAMSTDPNNLHMGPQGRARAPATGADTAPGPGIAAAVARMVRVLPQAWRFARGCMRLTGCSDDYSPLRPVDHSIVDRANDETFPR
jgi:hypothetical protein